MIKFCSHHPFDSHVIVRPNDVSEMPSHSTLQIPNKFQIEALYMITWIAKSYIIHYIGEMTTQLPYNARIHKDWEARQAIGVESRNHFKLSPPSLHFSSRAQCEMETHDELVLIPPTRIAQHSLSRIILSVLDGAYGTC